MKIEVIKDTPFHCENTILSESMFRSTYVNSKEDGAYNTVDLFNKYPKFHSYFKIVHDREDYENIPLDFIFERKLYSKQLDGFYHKFIVGMPIIKENSLGAVPFNDVLQLYHNAKYKTVVQYLYNNVNKKLCNHSC